MWRGQADDDCRSAWVASHPDGGRHCLVRGTASTAAASLLPPLRAALRLGVEVGGGADADRTTALDAEVRDRGIRIRLPGETAASVLASVTVAATDRGLRPEPDGATTLAWQLRTSDPAAAAAFWSAAVNYGAPNSGAAESQAVESRADVHLLADPHRRHPDLEIVPVDEAGSERQRIHVDACHPRTAEESGHLVAEAGGTTLRSNEWFHALADVDRNEVDVVWGQPMSQDPAVSDWWVLFGAVVRYPTPEPETAIALASAVAEVGDRAGVPLSIDLRPGAVVLDSGKDRWEREDFAPLAARVQAIARGLGLTADTSAVQFLQLGIDGQDLGALQRFWCTALGLEPTPNDQNHDLIDPRWLQPPMILQTIDASEADRLAQPNRWLPRVSGPSAVIDARLAALRRLDGVQVRQDESPEVRAAALMRWQVTDAEGNEVCLESWG